MPEYREISTPRRLWGVIVVTVPAVIVVLCALFAAVPEGITGGSFDDVAMALSITAGVTAFAALSTLMLHDGQLGIPLTRWAFAVFGGIAGGAAGWLLASIVASELVGNGRHVVSPLWAIGGVLLGIAAFGWLAAQSVGRGTIVAPVDLPAAGRYFGRPFASTPSADAAWRHNIVSRQSLVVTIVVGLCTVAVAVLAARQLAGIDELADGGLIGIALCLVLLVATFLLFLFTAVTTYRLDATGFTETDGLFLRTRRVPLNEIISVGIAATGSSLTVDYEGFDLEERLARNAAFGVIAQSSGIRVFGTDESCVLLVVETVTRKPTGALVRKTDVPALERAAALVDARGSGRAS